MFLKIFNQKRYVSEQSLKWSLKNQFEMNSKTLEQLHKLGITNESRLKLQFFYCTNRSTKARKLVSALEDLNYQVESVDKAAGDKFWVISGWTNEIKMDPKSVTNWTSLMNHLGYEYDSGFDGWGTYAE
jgi:hypothetical protein